MEGLNQVNAHQFLCSVKLQFIRRRVARTQHRGRSSRTEPEGTMGPAIPDVSIPRYRSLRRSEQNTWSPIYKSLSPFSRQEGVPHVPLTIHKELQHAFGLERFREHPQDAVGMVQ